MTTRRDTVPTSVDGVLEKSIHDIDIPPRPLVIDQISAEMRREMPDLRNGAQLNSRDVSLAAGRL